VVPAREVEGSEGVERLSLAAGIDGSVVLGAGRERFLLQGGRTTGSLEALAEFFELAAKAGKVSLERGDAVC